MKTLYTFLLSLLLSITVYGQYTCDCEPTTDIAEQKRTGAKHESRYSEYAKVSRIITPAEIYTWDEFYKSETVKIKDNPHSVLSERKEDTPEDSLYTLEGYMYFVKQEPNDCDFHIEIGGADPDERRVVVEVTQENCQLQKKIYNKMKEFSYSMEEHFTTGIHCKVTGLGFYDKSHSLFKKVKIKKTKQGKRKWYSTHGDEHTDQTIWELHPVKEIEFY